MLIDWFTVGAQALNFIILVWLLKRFLYKPILNAIDARERRIAAQLADANQKKTEAQREREEYELKSKEIDQQRAVLLRKATDEAKAERERLLGDAREAADALSARRQEALRAEAQKLNQDIRRRTQREVFAIARKVLADLAGTSLEERMCDVFIRRLRAIDGKARESLGEALKGTAAPALLRSAFDLAPAQRTAIQKALDETFPAGVRVRFEDAPDLVGGVELSTNGLKIAWSIADYLSSLEDDVAEFLKYRERPESQPATKHP